MTDQPFEAVARRVGTTAILDLNGEINSFADSALSAAYAQAVQDDPPAIVLNFSGVSYINSTGIALIVGILAQARTAHRKIAAYGLTKHYQQIFEITRLSDFMSIRADEAGALTDTESTTENRE